MVVEIQSLAEISGDFEAIVLDQWGVLHNGAVPYAGVPDALKTLADGGVKLAVLSNSGRRAAANATRIAKLGYRSGTFAEVMTSGEALWRDLSAGRLSGFERLYAVSSRPNDAEEWIAGLGTTTLADTPEDADGVLLMGLSDTQSRADIARILERAGARDIPVICSNPDHASPRAGGQIVSSIGALALEHERRGGRVIYYGKPHRAVFDALMRSLQATPSGLVIVGDSLDHDIAGAHAVGWKSVFVQGGLHAERFSGGDAVGILKSLVAEKGTPEPDYMIGLAR